MEHVIFNNPLFSIKEGKNFIPALVPNEFFTSKRDYGKDGKLVNYLISRIGISVDTISKFNDSELLFAEMDAKLMESVFSYCDGKTRYQDIVLKEGLSREEFDAALLCLTKLRILFWTDEMEKAEEFRKYLLENIMASAMPAEILYSYIYKRYGIAYMFAPSKFTFVVTNKCNARCRTCYRGEVRPDVHGKYRNELTTDDICETIGYLKQIGTDRIKFLGGEPFCREDIFELLRFAHNKNMMTELSTNGVLLGEDSYIEKAKELNRALFGLQISIDGLEASQNLQREGADFHKVIGAIEKLKRADINFTTNTVVSRVNMHELEPLIELLAHFGVHGRFQIMKACGTGYENFQNIPNPEEKKQIIERIDAAAKKYQADIQNAVIFHPFVNERNRGNKELKLQYHRCRACTYGMAVTPEGYSIPCEFLEPFPEFKGANIKEESILDIWHSSEMFKKLRYVKIEGRCARCEYNYMCEMGCFSETYGLTKKIEVSDPVCWYVPESGRIIFPESNQYILDYCRE